MAPSLLPSLSSAFRINVEYAGPVNGVGSPGSLTELYGVVGPTTLVPFAAVGNVPDKPGTRLPFWSLTSHVPVVIASTVVGEVIVQFHVGMLLKSARQVTVISGVVPKAGTTPAAGIAQLPVTDAGLPSGFV